LAVSYIGTELSLTYLKCRSWRHAWDDFNPKWDPPVYGYRESLRCTRCGTERHYVFDFHHRLISKRYIYPDGYKQKGVPQVVFREALFDKLRAKLEASNAMGSTSAPRKKKAAV
jgi:hypothetical protein